MTALVVYESMFGNTRAVAEAIAAGLAAQLPTELMEIGAAPALLGDDVDLLVVGGPTHAMSMSRPATRQSAGEQTDRPLVSAGIGLREWLDGLRGGGHACAAATFDTRADKPRLPGSAAKAAAKRLRRAGFRLLVEPENFWVHGTPSTLVAGEKERARQWGETLARSAQRSRRLQRG